MGDPSHLEKMGRELKCPICLSLLDSAVSLPCNHVFCISCLEKSMKLGFNCPVCKLPFWRRGTFCDSHLKYDLENCLSGERGVDEVRPALHMDNLVSIYRSMEVASGINIFVTQNATSAKFSDGGNQLECNGEFSKTRADRKFAQEESHKMSKSKSNNSIPISVRPSFPRKRRVQVPQCSLSETPRKHAKFESKLNKMSNEEQREKSTISKEKTVQTEEGKFNLTPFFWLRDEEREESSQHTDEDQFLDLPTPKTPSFSDVKDSDDEKPSKLTSTEETHDGYCDFPDFLDSEMFEWTQRPCSPELCPSPLKIEDAGIAGTAGTQRKNLKTALPHDVNVRKCMKNSKAKATQQTRTSDGELPNIFSPEANGFNNQVGSKKSNRGRKKAREGTKNSNANLNVMLGEHGHSNRVTEVLEFKETSENAESSFGTNRTSKRKKKAHFGTCVTKSTSDHVLGVSIEELPDHCDEIFRNECLTLLDKREGSEGGSILNMTIENSTNIRTREHVDSPLRSVKKQKLNNSKAKMIEELPMHQKLANEHNIDKLGPSLSAPAPVQKASKQVQESKSSNRELGSKRRVKQSGNRISGEKRLKKSTNSISGDEMVHVLEGQGNGEPKVNDEIQVSLNSTSTTEKFPLNKAMLRKCKNNPCKILCAFCLSSEETKASGEMVHYCNGKSIAMESSEKSKVIHSHQNCTEWAPNVYFEEDVAINLEAEVSRSRRIKCSCCDLRGAALGCYEKSCRKSFHVPCAKLIPQCRWDTDNFVMLCPLHADSKLPCESSVSKPIRQKFTLEGAKPNKVSGKNEINTGQKWNCLGSSKKFVLCCSSLTTPERESISEFERLAGVTVSKNWDASVTHVIASTNENGACKRTLKVLMGILEGKWVLSIGWIKSCLQISEPVDEEQYEITIDVHGVRGGPRIGRLRALNKEPKLFEGFRFFFMGDFEPSYKGYLQDLVIAAGGTLLNRKPLLRKDEVQLYGSSNSQTFVIYSCELSHQIDVSKKNIILNRCQLDAVALASSAASKAASNSWVLNSIAACKLQPF